MKTEYHLLMTIPLTALAYYLHGPLFAVFTLFFGWLVDADHTLDFFMQVGYFTLNPVTIYKYFNHKNPVKTNRSTRVMFCPLHAWEIAFVIALFFPTVTLISYLLHLTFDIWKNRYCLSDLFILYRLHNNLVVGVRT